MNHRRAWRSVQSCGGVTTLMLALTGCGSTSPTAPTPQTSPTPLTAEGLARALPMAQDSANFTYHYSAGDAVDPQHEEAWLAWAVAHLGVSPPQKIQYYKYMSTAQMQQITGMSANGWADPATFSVHTIFVWQGHEVVHVLTTLVGRPSDFFNEGIAVSMQVDPDAADPPQALWNGAPLDAIARVALAQGRLPHVQDMAETTSFRTIADVDGYPWAGSFVQFLVASYGMTRTLDFFRGGGGRDEPLAAISSRFQQTFGLSLPDADLGWRTRLGTGLFSTDRP